MALRCSSELVSLSFLGILWLSQCVGCGSQTASDQPNRTPAAAGKHAEDPNADQTPTQPEVSARPDDLKGHEISVFPAPERTEAALVAVPLPDLSVLGRAVQRQLRDAQASLAEVCHEKNVSSVRLSADYGAMGRLYHAYDLLDAAKACYDNARALAPNEFRWCYYLADVYRRQQDLEKTIPALEAALKINHDYVPGLVALGEIHLEAGRADQAKPLLERALQLDSQSAASRVGLGKIAASQKDFNTAIRHFESALSRQPKATAIHYPLAMAYRGKGNVAKAKTHLQKRGETRVKLVDPLLDELVTLRTGVRHHVKRGVAAGQAGNLDRAVAELHKAVETDPDSPSPRMNLGTALALSGDEDGAINQYRHALRLQPKSPEAHGNLAVLLANRADLDGAERHYRQAIELDPQFAKAHLGLANLLVRTGNHAQAASLYGHVVEIDPRHGAARLAQVVALSRAGRPQEAYRRLTEARAVLPESFVLEHAMARLLAACPDEKVRDAKRALELALSVFKSRNNPQHAETVAMAYAELGNFEEAIRWQSEIVQGAEKANRADLLPRARHYLLLYRDGKACRDPWPTDGGDDRLP